MNPSFQRMYAIFNKDLKDVSKNLYVSSTFLLPLFYAWLFARGQEDAVALLPMIANLTFATVGAFLQAAVIAEEREKGTLRGLMLSPASIGEILTGKSMLSLLGSVLVLFLCVNLLGGVPSIPGVAWAGFALILVFYLALGTLIGLMSKSLLEASIFILPVIMILGMGSLFTSLIADAEWLAVVEILPNLQFEKLFQASGNAEVLSSLAWIAGWTVVTIALTVWWYQKRTVDE
ncbi:ABC transporter permease [Halobacillus litoralis]|uniref:ABC transporter permease n=1 Tax=Halobacillus litoralis TaxID=45668 RepID=UPI001CD79CDB|nr:ABC transporter permease [Halobacillus litoralis]MCA0970545.1 ABC transporter permease [Halobacillus litoralis]